MPDVLEQGTLATTRQNLLDYFQTHDVKYIADDAIFKNLSTGEVYSGKAEIAAMLHFIYHVGFDARAEMISNIITEEKAVVEGFFKGRNIGPLPGLPATNKEVDVPICINYDLKDGLIKEARIYMMTDVMTKQLGVQGAMSKTTYLVRDIFRLKFGRFREAKVLLNEAFQNGLLPEASAQRVLSDFTGDSYRLIFEEGFASLEAYEHSLSDSMKADEWQQWYEKFKPLVESSHREILKQVI